jgi:CubicO group peptidase (beta-lactamase class C family)
VTDALQRALETRLRRAQGELRLPSVVGAAFRDGEVVWQEAIGLADVASGERASTGHAYRIGSITKTFTAVTIMQLRDQGRLRLDDPVRAHLPEFPGDATVRQALAHMSGVQREPAGEIWETMQAPTREELVAGLAQAEQVLAPGTHWHYSNLAFSSLGEVVARLGGAYEQVLRDRVLDPLGLARTELRPGGMRATPYFVHPYADAARVEPDPEVTESTGAAGWLWSTVGDLARWGDFLCTGADGVLARATVDEMARVQTMVDSAGWTSAWGLGLELSRRGDRVLAGHGGAMPGFLAALVVERSERTGAAVLMNTTAGGDPVTLALDLACATLDALEREPRPWAPAPLDPELEPLLGLWWTEGERLVLSVREGRLQAQAVDRAGMPVSCLEPDGPDRWRVSEGRERGELLRAVRDESGTVVKLYLATYPATRHPSTFGEATFELP